MIDISRDHAPDIPPALASFLKSNSLKPKNLDQLLQQSGLPDFDTLAASDFLQNHIRRMQKIEEKNGNLLIGEALHHAAMIEARREMQAAAAAEQTVNDARNDTSHAMDKVVAEIAG